MSRLSIPGAPIRLLALVAALLWGGAAGAQDDPFAPGWDLVLEASSLKVQSVKNVSVIESSSFATFSGEIDETGRATVEVALESIDTGIDLRNVRMRFLFFETYKHPVATIRLDVGSGLLRDLPAVRRLPVRLDYELELHGVTRRMTAEVVVTLITDGLVSVSSTTPIPIPAAEFGMAEGIRRLEDAAKVTIIPAGSVSFDFIFKRRAAPSPPAQAEPSQAEPVLAENAPARDRDTSPAPAAPALQTTRRSEALEPETFDYDACVGRFEILSRAGAIHFAYGSARLDAASEPLLETLADIVMRCPGLRIEVAGHTDSSGSAMMNQRLSEARARAVQDWLVRAGIDPGRVEARGYGEERPVVPNDTRRNRALNRRIEFSVIGRG